MRYARSVKLLLLAIVGCATQASPPPPVHAAAIAHPPAPKNCLDAALGFSGATISMHAPNDALIEPVRMLCASEQWSMSAIECFAVMRPDDLIKCGKELTDASRDALYRELAGTGDEATIAVTRAKLATVEIGVADCDQFVTEVGVVLACDGIPLEKRVALGNETVEMWDLPTKRLTNEVSEQMARVCSTSLATLQRVATAAGCMP